MDQPDKALIDAYAVWRQGKKDDVHYSAETLIAATRATTIDGLAAKARVLLSVVHVEEDVLEVYRRMDPDVRPHESLDWGEKLVRSLIDDLKAMRAAGGSTQEEAA